MPRGPRSNPPETIRHEQIPVTPAERGALHKREQEDVKTLVKKIAANSATGAKLLEEFARPDPSITLDDIRLPGPAG